MSSVILWRYSFAILFCSIALSGSEPAKVDRLAAQDAEYKASPEMDRLRKLYLGSWDYTETYTKTPFYPQGGSDAGVYTSEPGPGGNSIVNRFHSHGAVGDFEGLLVITWDPKENAYKSYVFGNDFPGCIVQTGQFRGRRCAGVPVRLHGERDENKASQRYSRFRCGQDFQRGIHYKGRLT